MVLSLFYASLNAKANFAINFFHHAAQFLVETSLQQSSSYLSPQTEMVTEAG
jgi:hypothetical protein